MKYRSETSKVRTNKLWCSKCKCKIKIGELAEFELDNDKMVNVYCTKCADDSIDYEYDMHPYSEDAIQGEY